MERYSSEYEEHINPFNAFHSRVGLALIWAVGESSPPSPSPSPLQEKQRRIQNMTPGDRIILTIGQAVMGSKTARLVFLAYALFLHFLVFLVRGGTGV